MISLDGTFRKEHQFGCGPDQSYSYFSKLKNSTATSKVTVDFKKVAVSLARTYFLSSLGQKVYHRSATYQNYSHRLPKNRISSTDDVKKTKMKDVRTHIQNFYLKQSEFIIKTHDEL